MRILVLNSGLFPDADTMMTAVADLADDHQVVILDLTTPQDDADWDDVVDGLMTADRIVTV